MDMDWIDGRDNDAHNPGSPSIPPSRPERAVGRLSNARQIAIASIARNETRTFVPALDHLAHSNLRDERLASAHRVSATIQHETTRATHRSLLESNLLPLRSVPT